MIENSHDVPVNATTILVSGNARTQLSFFEAELSDSVSSSSTLGELHHKLSMATNKMLQMNLFDVVDTQIELESLSKTGVYKTNVIVNVKEKGIPFLTASSFVKTGSSSSDAGFELEAALRNVTGHGEIFKAVTNKTQTGSREFNSTLFVPHVTPWNGNLQVTAKSGEDNQAIFTSFRQQINSLVCDYTSRDNRHKLTAEYSLRDEIPVMASEFSDHAVNMPAMIRAMSPSRTASIPTILSAAASVKTSLKYAWTVIDDRDSASSPSQGSLLQTSLEVAAKPGNAQFVRSEVTSQFHRTWGPSLDGQPGLVSSFCGSLGLVYPLQRLLSASQGANASTSYRTYLSDKYQLGGPLSLRGFEVSGIGARAFRSEADATSTGSSSGSSGGLGSISSRVVDLGDSMGGDSRSSFLAALSVPIPLTSGAKSASGGAQLRAFVFVNGGSLGNSSYWKLSSVALANSRRLSEAPPTAQPAVSLQGRAMPLFGYLRASTGAGLSLSLADSVRLELCYSVPLFHARQDNLKAFQLGLGLTIN